MAKFRGKNRWVLFDNCVGEIQYFDNDTLLCLEDGSTVSMGKLYSVYMYQHGGYPNYFSLDEIKKYKRVELIEKLCDEFVVVYNESKKFSKPFTSVYCDIKDVLKEHDLSECEIYGAIWTDEGLIYVAKMNSTSGSFEPIVLK